ncbi:uncharacterized protein LOC143911322 [Arctopsyche grandis]|uniref:uncharacterized protein LOC143911322 n=1 Tax=Arctopsyche grandis TaxID=121162 RepID=UPI00406D6526
MKAMAITRNLLKKGILVQWDQTFSGMIIFICILAAFPVTESYTNLKETEKAPFAANCVTDVIESIDDEDKYVVHCTGVNVKDLTAMLEKEVENFENGTRSIDYLLIESLAVDTKKLSEKWIDTTSFRIKLLKIISAKIDSIEINAFKGFAFETVTDLYIHNTKINTLEEGTFEGLQSVTILEIYKCEVILIKENALKAIAPTLQQLGIQYIPLNPINLTGTFPFPQLTKLEIHHTKMPKLDSASFSRMEKAEIVYVGSNEIQHIDCGTFEKMKSLKTVSVQKNLLTALDSCVFGNDVINSLEYIWIDGNSWNCICELEWLKDLRILDRPKCASHSDKPFDDVEFCEET